MEQIEWKGTVYKVRELYLGKHEGYRNVAQTELARALEDKNGEYKGKAADVDDLIWYYADEEEWKLSDRALLMAIKISTV